MNTRDIATEYRLSHWAGVLQERNVSGLSIKAYCERTGLRENVYFYWQRKLREAACEELAERVQNEASGSEKGLVPNGWTACKTGDGDRIRKPLVLEVGGCLVHVEPETDLTLLAKVCRALTSPC